MLWWPRGLFDLDPPDTRAFPNAIDVSVQSVLMEGLRQMDELNVIKDQLPSLRARVRIETPLVAPLRALSPNELDVIQLAMNFGVFEQIMNRSLTTDLDTAQIVLRMIKAGYLRCD
jgi:hypothetical protein